MAADLPTPDQKMPDRPPHDAGVETWLWYERSCKRFYRHLADEAIQLAASSISRGGCHCYDDHLERLRSQLGEVV